jgi:hypothetical protein
MEEAVAATHAGHAADYQTSSMFTYIIAPLEELAAALSVLTAEPHPPAAWMGLHATRVIHGPGIRASTILRSGLGSTLAFDKRSDPHGSIRLRAARINAHHTALKRSKNVGKYPPVEDRNLRV